MKQAHVVAPLSPKGKETPWLHHQLRTRVLVEGEGTGRKEAGASGHMQNPIFEELKACYICKI